MIDDIFLFDDKYESALWINFYRWIEETKVQISGHIFTIILLDYIFTY